MTSLDYWNLLTFDAPWIGPGLLLALAGLAAAVAGAALRRTRAQVAGRRERGQATRRGSPVTRPPARPNLATCPASAPRA